LKPEATWPTALLLAAHGERRPGADNEGVFRIVRALTDRRLVSEVALGFINGVPSIRDALGALTTKRIIVYPLLPRAAISRAIALCSCWRRPNIEAAKLKFYRRLVWRPCEQL